MSIATVAPPQQSPEEIRAMEAEATFTVQQVAATAFMLYLCAYIMFTDASDSYAYANSVTPLPPGVWSKLMLTTPFRTAPFAIDMVSRIF